MAPGLAERLEACREELSACHPDLCGGELLAARRDAGPAARAALGLEELRGSLRAQKFLFLQAQEQAGFVASQESERRDSEPAELGERRSAGKEDVRELKRQHAREEESRRQLVEELEKVYQHNLGLYEQGLQDLKDATGAANFEGEAAVDFPQGPQGHHAAAAEAMEEALRLHEATLARDARRSELEAELLALQEQAKEERRRARSYRKREAQEDKAKANLEALLVAESQLGFPRYEFDDARNVVVVSPPEGTDFASSARAALAVQRVDEIMRTVSVGYDVEGRLVQAEAHPVLDLRAEAAAAVEQDDLGRLLTAVWARLCGAAEQAEAEDASARAGPRGRRGGA